MSNEAPRGMRRVVDSRDIIGAVGLGLLSYGMWQVYPPAAFIVAGVILIASAIAAARRN